MIIEKDDISASNDDFGSVKMLVATSKSSPPAKLGGGEI